MTLKMLTIYLNAYSHDDLKSIAFYLIGVIFIPDKFQGGIDVK